MKVKIETASGVRAITISDSIRRQLTSGGDQGRLEDIEVNLDRICDAFGSLIELLLEKNVLTTDDIEPYLHYGAKLIED
jgi:hypothetical protein